jgi:hypothetical protein
MSGSQSNEHCDLNATGEQSRIAEAKVRLLRVGLISRMSSGRIMPLASAISRNAFQNASLSVMLVLPPEILKVVLAMDRSPR